MRERWFAIRVWETVWGGRLASLVRLVWFYVVLWVSCKYTFHSVRISRLKIAMERHWNASYCGKLAHQYALAYHMSEMHYVQICSQGSVSETLVMRIVASSASGYFKILPREFQSNRYYGFSRFRNNRERSENWNYPVNEFQRSAFHSYGMLLYDMLKHNCMQASCGKMRSNVWIWKSRSLLSPSISINKYINK